MIWPFRRLTPIGRVLRRARQMIERKGWSQACVGGIWTPSGVCAAWAIVQAGRKSGQVQAATAAFVDHNALPYPKPDYNPTQRTTVWNDTKGRSKAEVLHAFRKAEEAETVRWTVRWTVPS